MSSHSNAAVAFASVQSLQDVAVEQAKHSTEIINIKEANRRIEDKLDKLFYWILGTLGAALVGILVSLIRH